MNVYFYYILFKSEFFWGKILLCIESSIELCVHSRRKVFNNIN